MRTILGTSLALAVLWVPTPAQAAPPRCHGLAATVVGTSGDDYLRGTDGRDVIVGLGGADTIRGRGGDDVICGGANTGYDGRQLSGDDIDGGPGSDWIDPGTDRRPVGPYGYGDVLRYSRATTGIQADLSGRTGTVVVGDDTDTIRVAAGLWVLGSRYDDTIVGSRFADDLEGNQGADRLYGRHGDDGIDEYADGLSHTDRDADLKVGGAGEDSVQTNGGADVLQGGAGDDVLHEQAYSMAAAMAGGGGDDALWVWYDAAATRTLDAGAGTDLLEVDNTDPYEPAGAQLVVDAAAGTVHTSVPGQAVLTATGVERWKPMAEQTVVFLGSPGPDWVDARIVDHLLAQTFGGDDFVKGSGGGDTVDAGDGYDRVDGRLGQDTCLNAEHLRRCEATATG